MILIPSNDFEMTALDAEGHMLRAALSAVNREKAHVLMRSNEAQDLECTNRQIAGGAVKDSLWASDIFVDTAEESRENRSFKHCREFIEHRSRSWLCTECTAKTFSMAAHLPLWPASQVAQGPPLSRRGGRIVIFRKFRNSMTN